MRDEKETLRRLIEDAVEAELRYLSAGEHHPRDLGDRIAREVLHWLASMRIQVTSAT